MDFPRNLKYAKTHEWARREESKVVVGISEYAQKELADVVFVELPRLKTQVKQGQACAVVESVKAAFDIYAPVSGEIIGVNRKLATDPSLINRNPYGEGWFFEIRTSDASEMDRLLDAETYGATVHEGAS
mgnify:CR=1 FL=1